MVMLWNLVVLVGFVVERGGGQKAGHPTYAIDRSENLAHPCKCSYSNYSRDKFLDSLRLRRPSVRLTLCSGSATNTDSARKKCRVRL